jgi:beta-mannanase
MNGTWFPYGQLASAFKQSWIRVVSFFRQNLKSQFRNQVAFIWAPNSGNGYPYPLLPPVGWSPNPNATEGTLDRQRINELDTNGDGVLDGLDDPYQPYYPGDEWVDWVGISVYHCK